MKLLPIFFVSLFFASCVTQKACLQKYPIKETHDTLIVYRDTTVNISVVGTDTVYRWSTLYDTIYASSGTAHSVSYVTHDTLRVMVWQSDTVYKVKYDSLLQVKTVRETQTITIKEPCAKGKGAIFIEKLIILIAIIFGGVLIIYLIKLFK